MYESRRILKQVLKFLRLFCVAYDCRKQVVGLSTRHVRFVSQGWRQQVAYNNRKQKSHRVDEP
jgi:hypothetical protein